MHRRTFLAVCAAVPFAGACTRYTVVTGRLDGGRVVVARAALADEPFAMVDVPALNFPIYVHRQGPDAYTAVLTRCTHRGCAVEPEGGKLVCPCHGSEYTTAGALLRGPAQRDLTPFPVQTDAENVYVLDVVRVGRAAAAS